MSKIKVTGSRVNQVELDAVIDSNYLRYYKLLKVYDKKYSTTTAKTFVDFCQSVGVTKVNELLSGIIYTSTCEEVGAELTCSTTCRF